MKIPVIAVFVGVFLLLLVITIGFPSLPPGSILYSLSQNVLGVPEITADVLGIPGQVLVEGIINGVVWGIGISMIYGLGRWTSQREAITVPKRVSPPMPAPVRRKSRSTARKIRTYVKLNINIESIEGIGPEYGSRFRALGVKDVDNLLRVGSTWKGRRDLADHVGVATKVIDKWVNQADFFRIKGIGTQYADLLDATGVTTVTDLSRKNPYYLHGQMTKTNKDQNLVRRTPPYGMVKGWIQSAKKLQPMVKS